MSVKFRVGFTLTGETLFGLIAKMLPIEDLSVEELALAAPAEKLLPKQAKLKAKFKRKSPGPDLTKGVNKIIVDYLADGEPHRAVELEPLIEKGGYSANGVGARLQALLKQGVVEHLANGQWRLVKR